MLKLSTIKFKLCIKYKNCNQEKNRANCTGIKMGALVITIHDIKQRKHFIQFTFHNGLDTNLRTAFFEVNEI